MRTSSAPLAGEASAATTSDPPTSEFDLLPPQLREWKLLVTSLLQSYVSLATDAAGTYGDEQNPRATCSPTSPLAAPSKDPDGVNGGEETVRAAVREICTWAATVQLGVDGALLSAARAKAEIEFSGAQQQQTHTRREKDDVGSTAAEDGGQLQSSEASSSRPPVVGDRHGMAHTECSLAEASPSRMAHRLASAWKRATALPSVVSSAPPPLRALHGEATIREGFEEAVAQLHTSEDATTSAEFVLSKQRTLAHLVWQRAAGMVEPHHRGGGAVSVEQHLALFLALSEEVLKALERAATAAPFRDGAASSEDQQRAFRESAVVVSASELATLSWSGSRTCVDVSEVEKGSSSSSSSVFALAECKLRTLRAVRHLSRAVSRLFANQASSTQATTAAAAPSPLSSSSFPASGHGSRWLANRIAELQQGGDADTNNHFYPYEVFLLRTLVSAGGALYSGNKWKDNTPDSSSQVEAAVRLTITVAAAPSASASLLPLLRDALQLPLFSKHSGGAGVSSASRWSSTSSNSSRARSPPSMMSPTFVCWVLDSCPARLSYALLTGALRKEDAESSSATPLSPIELANLASVVHALSSGLNSYRRSSHCTRCITTDRSHKGKGSEEDLSSAVATKHGSSPQSFLSGDAACGSVPFLARIFDSMDAASLVVFGQQLLNVGAGRHLEDSPALAVHPLQESTSTEGGSYGVLNHVIASIADLETRGVVAQALLHHVCRAAPPSMTSSSPLQNGRQTTTQLPPQQQLASVMGVLMESLLSNPASSPRTAASCAQHCLHALTQWAAEDRLGTRESYDERRVLYSAVRQWFTSSTQLYLFHHARLFLEAATASDDASLAQREPKGGAIQASAAQQCAAWFNDQLLHLASHASSSSEKGLWRYPQQQQQQHKELMQLCSATARQITGLCRLVSYQLQLLREGPSALTPPSAVAPLSPSSARHNDVSIDNTTKMQAVCAAAYNADYDSVGVAYLCHLAVASSARTAGNVAVHAPSTIITAPPSFICAFLQRSDTFAASSAAFSATRGSLLTLRSATPADRQEGPLNALQLHHGRPLSATQHEQLGRAMQDFSHHRRVHDAVALFYSYERQDRRLELAEVELFAETAKRATTPFLVRLLTYVPPPCESAALATAIVAGAWKGYQRAWRRYRQEGSTAPRSTSRQAQPHLSSSSSLPASASAASVREADAAATPHLSSVSSRWHQRQAVEQAWYEALAIALQAIELLPTSPHAALNQSAQHALVRTLYRLLLAQPQWIAHSPRTGMTGGRSTLPLRTAVLMNMLLLSPSPPLAHRLMIGEWMQRTVDELRKTLDFCEVHHDAATTVRAYLHFVGTHTAAASPNASPSPTSRVINGAVDDGVASTLVPLLPVDTYVSLLSLSSTHVTTSEGSLPGWSAALHAGSAAAEDGEHVHHARTPPPPTSSAHATPRSADVQREQQHRRQQPIEEESDMEQLCRLRATMEENADEGERRTTPPTPTTGTFGDAIHTRDSDSAKLDEEEMAKADDGHTTSAAAAAMAASALRRSHAFEANGAAVFQFVAVTLPSSLRRRVEGDDSLLPLVTVLHDALRWCRLKPRQVSHHADVPDISSSRDNDGFWVDGAWAGEDAAEDSMTAGADVLIRLLCSALHLESSEVYAASLDALPGASRQQGGSNDSTGTSCLLTGTLLPLSSPPSTRRITCCVCTCRSPHEPASWKLMRHADVLLEYALCYLRELHALEHGVLWISPAQQQRADAAMVECLQVITAVMEAVDVWAAEHKVQMLNERGCSSVAAASTAQHATTIQSNGGDAGAAEDVTDALRVRLRGTPLDLLKQLLPVHDSMGEVGSGVHPQAVHDLTCVVRGDVAAFEKCSPAHPFMRQLCGSAGSGPRQFNAPISADPLHELVRAITQGHFSVLTAFIEDVAFADVDAAAVPTDRAWVSKRLAYVLRCLTANRVGATDSQSGASSSGGGAAQALVARVAAADVTLRRLSSHLTDLAFTVEATAEAVATSTQLSVSLLLSQLTDAAHDSFQAALLLDECSAWWNTLHLESSVGISTVRGIADGITASSTHAGATNWLLLYHSCLAHVQRETARLRKVLRDLYTSVWWGDILPRVQARFAACAARFWSDEGVRFHNLYVSVALQHHNTATASDEYRRDTVQCAFEKLQQALVRHLPSTLAAYERSKTQLTHPSVDMDELLNDHDTAEEREIYGKARRALDVERALVDYLVRSSPQLSPTATQRALNTNPLTSVSAEVFEKAFQAALSGLPWQHASLLWRTVPSFLEMEEAEEVGGAAAALGRAPVLTEANRESHGTRAVGAQTTTPGLTYTLPRTLWRLLNDLRQLSATAAAEKDRNNSEGCYVSTESVLSLALLSPAPLIVDGYLVHPLLRYSCTSRSADEAASRDETWLTRLIVYGMDKTDDSGATSSSSGDSFFNPSHDQRPEAHERGSLPVSYASVTFATATSTIPAPNRGASPAFSSSLLPTSLCRRVAPSLVLATLRDASLAPAAPLPTSMATASAISSALQPPASAAVSREALLVDLEQFLGYIAPEAWRVALLWIQNTPYPTTLCNEAHDEEAGCAATRAVSSVEVSSTVAMRKALSPVEQCTLRRLRSAFLACGPWPVEVAQPLLAYVIARQRQRVCVAGVHTTETTSSGGSGNTADALVVFPEAEDLYRLFSSTTHRESATEGPSCVMASAFARPPLICPVVARHVEDENDVQRRTGRGSLKGDPDPVVAAYCACDGGYRLPSYMEGGTDAPSRRARFRVTSPSTPPPLPSLLRWSTTSRNVASPSARQLVSQASADAHFAEAPPVLLSWLRRLSLAPSLPACASLVSSRPWKEAVLALHRRQLMPLLRVVWKTLLIRKVELDAAVKDATGNSTRSVKEEAPKGNASGLTPEEIAWREVCASLFAVIACAAARVTGTGTSQNRTRATAKMRRVVRQLTELRDEVCIFWICSLLEHALTRSLDANVRKTAQTDNAAWVKREEVEALFRSSMAAYFETSNSAVRGRAGNLQEHLRDAQWMLSWQKDGPHDAAAAAKPHTQSSPTAETEVALKALLTEACQQMQRAAKELVADEAVVDETRRAAAVRWLLWPPAVWEVWRAAQSPVKGSTSTLPLHNPLLVVALLRAWHRGRHDQRDQEQPPRGSAVANLVTVYAEAIAVLDAAEETTRGEEERQRVTSAGIGKWSLMHVWQHIDAYVHTGCVYVRGTATEQPVSCGAVVGGVSVVMEAFLQLISTEDARLRRRRDSAASASQAAASPTASDSLALKAVLRRLRPHLLEEEEEVEDETVTAAAPTSAVAVFPRLMRGATHPWSAYLPRPHGQQDAAPHVHSYGEDDCHRQRPPLALAATPWHTLLHVLHLCTAGLLDRSAHRRARRAVPTAAAMACVAQKLASLRQLQTELERSGFDHRGSVHDSASTTPPLLSFEDGQRILCWQLRRLQQIRTHENALGWTVEQQRQCQRAQQHLRASVTCVASLVHVRQAASASRQRSAFKTARYNAVEAATAACFYPHLEIALPLTTTTPHRSSLGADAGRSGAVADGDVRDEEEEVVTTFSTHKRVAGVASIAAASASSGVIRDEASATALLSRVRPFLHLCTSAESPAAEKDRVASSYRASNAQLQADYAVLHAYLAAVLGGVAQRRRHSDPTLLLDYITGAESTRVLHEVKHSPAEVVAALTRVLMHLVHLLSVDPLELTAGERSAIAEAGLRLCVALQPWMPVHRRLESLMSLCQLTDASLVLALCVVDAAAAAAPHQLSDATQSTSFTVRAKNVAMQLASCVVDDLVQHRQAESLSSRGIAILGVLHQRLAHVAHTAARPVTTSRHNQVHNAGDPPAHAQMSVDGTKLLRRVLHSCAVLSEREAAEVHQAWRSYTCDKAAAAAARVSEAGVPDVAFCGVDVIRGLYAGALDVVRSGGGAAAAQINGEVFACAVRWRTWWAANEYTTGGTTPSTFAAVAHIHVLEDLLCLVLLHQSGNAIHRSAHRACGEIYAKYVTMRKICGASCDLTSAGECSPAAAVALQLAIAAMLLPSAQVSPRQEEESNRTRSAVALSAAHLVQLLTAVPLLREKLCQATGAVRDTEDHETSLLTLRVDPHADIERISAHLLWSMKEQHHPMRDVSGSASTTTTTQDFPRSPLLGRWEAMVTPLRALRTAAAAFHGGSVTVEVRSTAGGLACRPVGRRTGPTLNAARQRLPCSFAPAHYQTLRSLVHAGQLSCTPLPVVLHELLLPLLVLETKAMSRTEGGGEAYRRLAKRHALLREVARHLAAHPALYCRNITAPGMKKEPFASPLTPAIEAAARTTVTAADMLTSTPDIAAAHPDLRGWPVALLLLKVLARLDELLAVRTAGFARHADPNAPASRSSVSFNAGSANAFASRYAASLAQRGRFLEDYLAFALVARHYTAGWEQVNAPSNTHASSSSISSMDAGNEVSRRRGDVDHRNDLVGAFGALDWAPLPHALAVAAAPTSVGALVALFRQPAAPPHVWPRVQEREGPKVGGDEVTTSAAREVREAGAAAEGVVVVVPAVTEAEMQELQRLDRLLAAST
ncbi:hypothetical protein ABB37_09048 [Leptomonas pyrrhocoris]|uniref:Uncharacterized protein n=1 Tax=Leptomonas pyrrhocoris TaxID=157538 RepID=A0A0M9FRV7_LEPPY|nr:hypothetical protein ABB37_09048 [Leptomonas pyrrhocoris]KPA74753.1 hypothetical protein ABB37_09048 [Leptomonas pyrrhocoris]|eukprot:XP_015653192.1 hypothetical protein ABB37_09048 [Leptomonas pyrrhocoris]